MSTIEGSWRQDGTSSDPYKDTSTRPITVVVNSWDPFTRHVLSMDPSPRNRVSRDRNNSGNGFDTPTEILKIHVPTPV